MAKQRIHEWAKERNLASKDVIGVLEKNGVTGKTASSNIEEKAIERVNRHFSSQKGRKGAGEAGKGTCEGAC